MTIGKDILERVVIETTLNIFCDITTAFKLAIMIMQ